MPKGVLLSHFNVLVRVAHTRDPRYKFDVDKSMLGLMPFFHGYGLIVSLCSIINSDQLVVLKKFDEDVFLRALQDYKISFLPLAPPLAIFLEKSPKVLKYDLSHVKSIVCGAAPLSKDTELGLKKRLKSLECIQQAYGLTEATLAVTLLDRKTVRSGSSGRVASYMSCKVRDPETGKSLGPNQVGELCFKGPMLMMGYYNDEKATRESFTSDGWLKTGDLGYYDDEGYFYIVDRLKELVKYKGFQVAPAELEAILLTHPKVRDAGVVGLPDELAGELPLAFVVKRDGAEISEQELQKFVAREDNTFVIRGPTPAAQISKRTLGEEILHSLLQNKPDGDAMIDAVTGEALSRRFLLRAACDTATALRRCGCTKGTVISICCDNSLQFFTPVVASLFLGCIVAPLNYNYTLEELEHALDISKPKIIFCSREVLPKFTELKRKRDHIDKVDCNETLAGAETMETFIERALMGQRVIPENFQPLTDDPAKLGAFILCSSGTTGMPKGVLLSHLNVLVRVAHRSEPRYKYDIESVLGLMPFFHGYGLIVSLSCIISSDQIIVLKRFDEDDFLRALQDYKISFLPLAPPLAVFLEKSPKVLKYDLSHLKYIVCGAAPLSKDTELGLKKRLKSLETIQQAYGLTEATLGVTLLDSKTERPGSSGKVVTYMSCKVRDPETGKSLGPNQIGELCFKGPMVMMGYYNDEKATRESFTSDGWLKTGDLGYYDDEGYFYIVDRLKELVKYKGFQVAPAELEAILLTHPKVRDVGVVGLPDELAGELPLAFVVKRDGAEVSEQELQEFVARVVSPQKRLRGGVVFVSEIPKNPSGKILRRVLRERLKTYKGKQESKL
ncbi:hypothetical protein NQ318_001042 [Aromia moschata]|uniref:Luciferin 4-monooxygenase n=1 Tax=Aromia moschata TaxID=1265417 RepID=A0AAV8ZEG7_9CUCU|nr:hypothetical protein NQ318_001042 [Aromia moschata]